MEQIEARILDRIYKLQVPVQERARLMQAVELVDRKMREIRDAGKAQGPDRIAVNAALQLVYEFLGRTAAAPLVADGMSADTTVAPDADPLDDGDQSDIGLAPKGSHVPGSASADLAVTAVTDAGSATRGAQPAVVDTKGAEGKATESNAAEVGGAAGKGTDAKGSDAKGTDAKSADAKGTDAKVTDAKVTDAKSTVGKSVAAKGTDGKALDLRAIDAKGGDTRSSSDGKRADPSSGAEVPAAGKRPETADNRRTEGKGAAKSGRAHEADKTAVPSSPDAEIERISSELEAEIRRQESLF
ncbi:MAG: cell division protein ZapA [Burkholderiaceae bacterium]